MIEILADAGSISRAEEMFMQMTKRTIGPYEVLVKAYGTCDRADQSSRLLDDMLKDTHVVPNIRVFNAAVDAWAKSTKPNSFEEAFYALRLTEHDDQCVYSNVRPDVASFRGLLQCLVASNFDRAGLMALTIIESMENYYRNGGPHLQPDVGAYSLAVKACFRVGDVWRAEQILRKMEYANIPIDIQVYNDVLQYCSQAGVSDTAELMEQILTHVKVLARTVSTLKPAASTYALVLDAWCKSGNYSASERIWSLYEDMKKSAVSVDSTCYWTIIQFLSTTRFSNHVQQADSLLREMEISRCRDTQPESKHFDVVVKGFIDAGDLESSSCVLARYVDAFLKRDGDKSVTPSPEIFQSVVNAWLEVGDVLQATLVIVNTQEQLAGRADSEISLDQNIYKTILNQWTTAQHPQKANYVAKIQHFLTIATVHKEIQDPH